MRRARERRLIELGRPRDARTDELNVCAEHCCAAAERADRQLELVMSDDANQIVSHPIELERKRRFASTPPFGRERVELKPRLASRNVVPHLTGQIGRVEHGATGGECARGRLCEPGMRRAPHVREPRREIGLRHPASVARYAGHVNRTRFPGRTRLPPLVGGVSRAFAECAMCKQWGVTLSPSEQREGICVPCLELAMDAYQSSADVVSEARGHLRALPSGERRK